MNPPLTAAQNAVIKNDIAANPDLNSKPNNTDGADAIAQLYNLPATPNFIVWKANVTITQVGDNIDATELAGLTQVNVTRLQCISDYSPGGINPSFLDRRKFFDDIFSGAGGNVTRPKLLALWKRSATRIEKVLATGTGSDASPATMGSEGPITYQEVQLARTS